MRWWCHANHDLGVREQCLMALNTPRFNPLRIPFSRESRAAGGYKPRRWTIFQLRSSSTTLDHRIVLKFEHTQVTSGEICRHVSFRLNLMNQSFSVNLRGVYFGQELFRQWKRWEREREGVGEHLTEVNTKSILWHELRVESSFSCRVYTSCVCV